MARVNDYLKLVNEPTGSGLMPGHPADDALIALLAHVAFSDGTVDDEELLFLERVLPGRDREELRKWAARAGAKDLDYRAIAAALPSIDERWTGLRFAARMAFKDGRLADEERVMLGDLSSALELPEGAIDRVLGEMSGRAKGTVTLERLEKALEHLPWGAVQKGSGAMRSNLSELLPPDATVLRRIGIDNVEVLGLCHEGLVGRFLEGNIFLPWDDIVTYSRVPVLGAAMQLHTEDGGRWTLVDHRLHGLCAFFDRLYRPDHDDRPRGDKPTFEMVRGEED